MKDLDEYDGLHQETFGKDGLGGDGQKLRFVWSWALGKLHTVQREVKYNKNRFWVYERFRAKH